MEFLLAPEQFEALRHLDACTLSNAIEAFNVRLRNDGFANGTSLRCIFPDLAPMLGYAATGRIRSSAPPLASSLPPPHLSFYHRSDWWDYVLSLPSPRVVVMQDVDRSAGLGALMGDLHVTICQALGCVGYVTNGAVRDLTAVKQAGFHFFAGQVSVSHAYAHVIDFGEPVEIGGLRIRPGDLLHGDRHGIQTIPKSIAPDIPAVAARITEQERRITEYCQSSGFEVSKLREFVKDADYQISNGVVRRTNQAKQERP
ncbi:MAG: RraA family protein [Terriglobia bacterium]